MLARAGVVRMVGDEVGSGLVVVDGEEEEAEESSRMVSLSEALLDFSSACSDARMSLKRRILRVLVGLSDSSVEVDRAGDLGWDGSFSSSLGKRVRL